MPDEKNVAELENKPVFRIFPMALDAIKEGFCPTCGKKIGIFKNLLSKDECEITGVCQECQDRISRLL